MSRNNNDGCGCLIIGGMILAAFVIINLLPAYFKALSGPYGGAWSIPLFLLLIVVICYFKSRKE